MLVRVSAFEVDICSENISLEQTVANLVGMNGIQSARREYYFDTQSFPGFCVGVIITIKDQRSFCTLGADVDGGHVIQVNGLEEGNSIMDFNFFAINMDNGIGLYQHYHQSASITALDRKFKDGLSYLKERLVGSEIAEAVARKGEDISNSAKVKIKRKYSSRVEVRTLVSKSTLRQLLQQYSKIKGMEYTYSVLSPVVLDATPLGNRVKKKKENIVFTNPNIVATLSREIADVVRNADIAKGRVFVEEADGTAEVIKIFDMPEYLWERDYDDVVKMIDNINVSDFEGNDFLRAVVDLFGQEQYQHILKAEVV